jgi:hypothetical protein
MSTSCNCAFADRWVDLEKCVSAALRRENALAQCKENPASEIYERLRKVYIAVVPPQSLSRATSIGNRGVGTEAQPIAKGPP